MSDVNEYPACSVDWTEHPGPILLCRELKAVRSERDRLVATATNLLRQRDAAKAERDALQAENAALRAALRPFAAVNIPDNWPGECMLTWEEFTGRNGKPYGAIRYLHCDCKGGATIDDYRRARNTFEPLGNSE